MIVLEDIYTFLASFYFILASRVFQPVLNSLFGPRISEQSKTKISSYTILADIKPFHAIHLREKRSFLLKFGCTKDLTYLDREDVTLYAVSEEEFVFVRTKPGVDLYNMEEHPFLYEIQHSSAVELLTASHGTIFEYLKSKPARDGSNISYVHNHGRCGSTLIATMMFKTKKCIVQSEPNPILSLSLMFNRQGFVVNRNTQKYLDLVRATFLLTCPDPHQLYFIKPWPIHTLSLLPLMKQALPGIRELFNCRSIKNTVISLKKLYGYNLNGVANNMISLLPVNYRNIWKKIKCGKGDEAWSFLLLCQVHAFILETQDREDIKTFSYESLVENKEEFTVKLLKEVGFGEECLHDALSALENHSQAKSEIISRLTSLAGVKDVSLSAQVMEWIVRTGNEEFELDIDAESGKFMEFSEKHN